MSLLRRRAFPLRRRMRLPILISSSIALLVCVSLLLFPRTDAGGAEARKVAEQFYAYEQSGDFGSAWELLHPYLKSKFKKDAYIQTRAHVFMQDFGVSTFEVQLGEPKRLTGWKMTVDTPSIDLVYNIPVKLSYASKFGIFHITQDVFLAKEVEEWRLLWSYRETP
jgi:hypothetical protein